MATRSPSYDDSDWCSGKSPAMWDRPQPIVCDLPHQIDILPGEAALLWSLLHDDIIALIGNG